MARLNHILESQQFDRSWIEKVLFKEAGRMNKMVSAGKVKPFLKNKSICLLFYEPSTRTRLSFQNAGLLLGANVASTENAKEFSSAVKGESLKDTIRTVNALGYNGIVIRSDVEGGALEAATVSKVPIINAGDAGGQHPTQSLLDLYTLYEKFGSIDGLTVAFVGDLAHSRSTNSLAYLFSKFKKVNIYFVSPPKFGVKTSLKTYLQGKNIEFSEVTNLGKILDKVDMVYLTRPQKERLKDGEVFTDKMLKKYRVGLKELSKMKSNTIVMDPLPRVGQLPEEVDSDPRVVIFNQVHNGLLIRMALLKLTLAPG